MKNDKGNKENNKDNRPLPETEGASRDEQRREDADREESLKKEREEQQKSQNRK